MYIYIDKDDSVVLFSINENITKFKRLQLSEEQFREVYEKIRLQTKEIKLFYKNGEFVFLTNVEQGIDILRKERNKKIKESDFMFLTDTSNLYSEELIENVKYKRNKLRNITENINTIEDVLKQIKYVKEMIFV